MVIINKILITGGAGFIGYHLSKALAKNDENNILIVDNLSKGKMDKTFKKLIHKSNVTFYEMDLSNLKEYSKLEQDYNQIYHLAAIVGVKEVSQNPFLTLKVNALSTIYILDFIKDMKNNPKILFASSCENYAGSIKLCGLEIPTPEEVPLCIEDVYNPRWSYATSKILGEIACLHCSKKYNFDTTIVRYHNIYGPRMGTQHVIPEFILRLKKDPTKLEMYGGYQYRSFCYVDDAVKMTVNLMNNQNANNKIVNIGNEHYIKISLLAEMLFKIMKISPKVIENGAPEGSVEMRRPDLKLIKKLDNYVSNISFDDGLRTTYEWYEKMY